MTSEILAFRKAAEELRRVRDKIDVAKYNARSLSRKHSNQVATVYAGLIGAENILDEVAEEIEEDVWGKA